MSSGGFVVGDGVTLFWISFGRGTYAYSETLPSFWFLEGGGLEG